MSVGENGLIMTFNPAAEEMFLRKKKEMIGKHLDSLMPEKYRKSHQRYVKSYFTTAKPNKAIGKMLELPALRSNGQEFPMEITRIR